MQYFTYYEDQELCLEFANCDEFDGGECDGGEACFSGARGCQGGANRIKDARNLPILNSVFSLVSILTMFSSISFHASRRPPLLGVRQPLRRPGGGRGPPRARLRLPRRLQGARPPLLLLLRLVHLRRGEERLPAHERVSPAALRGMPGERKLGFFFGSHSENVLGNSLVSCFCSIIRCYGFSL